MMGILGNLTAARWTRSRWFQIKARVIGTGLFLLFLSSQAPVALGADQDLWVRPQNPGDPLIWGRKDGILFGLPSVGGLPGPRGLIRVGVVSPETNVPQLVNFVAIEPVVTGAGRRFDRMAFSELEASQLDEGSRGKRLWVDPAEDFRGTLATVKESPKRIERLSVRIDVEKFAANGAQVYVVVSIDSDRPTELNLTVFQAADSPKIEELTLTATMGNFERLRWLFLKNIIVDSRVLYNSEEGNAFFEHENYPLEEMLRTAGGDAIALCATNEATPSSEMDTPSSFWHYPLPRMTQYWKVLARDIEPDLRVRVNGRHTYWGSHKTVPNGTAFENFEVRQRYRPGQIFIFGMTMTEPWAFEPPIPHLLQPDSKNEKKN
ncbi:MAG: hypothetical protein JSS69_01090 [Acidobacteria bacterium]|nr:hypothetical protein [Acidobacteriota bacterium]MBS1864488.1 hypothetical protein [Acidobacteriota bacterium]